MQLEGDNNCILVTELWMIFLPSLHFCVLEVLIECEHLCMYVCAHTCTHTHAETERERQNILAYTFSRWTYIVW